MPPKKLSQYVVDELDHIWAATAKNSDETAEIIRRVDELERLAKETKISLERIYFLTSRIYNLTSNGVYFERRDEHGDAERSDSEADREP